MNLIVIDNGDKTFTVFDQDVTEMSFDGSQVPTQIFVGTLQAAQSILGMDINMFNSTQTRMNNSQAIVDAITNYSPDTTQTQIQNVQNNLVKKTI
jgi:hypothetical protein